MPPLSTLISCVQKEVDYRIRRYPYWVAESKITQAYADEQINSMKWVLYVLQNLNNFMEKLR